MGAMWWRMMALKEVKGGCRIDYHFNDDFGCFNNLLCTGKRV